MTDQSPRGNGAERVVAVTGVSGLLGQRLLSLLDADPEVDRVVGLDVRDPARQARKLEFHRVDVLGAELLPYLRGVQAVAHLAAIVGPLPDDVLLRRVNVDGTRRVLDAATTAGVRTFVRPSSAAVYGAWANNPIPLTEDAPLRPSPGYQPAITDAECERLLADWSNGDASRVATRLRIAPVVGAGSSSLLAQLALGALPVRVRGATPPVQVVHVDDAASALALALTRDLDGAYNVAADGWLSAGEARDLLPRPRWPALPAPLARRALAISWSSGIGDAPPELLPYLVHPWVIATDRLEAAGWKPRHANDEALLLATPAGRGVHPALIAGAGAAVVGASVGTWWWRRRRR